MGYFWYIGLLLTAYIAFSSSASIIETLSKSNLSNDCLNTKDLNCNTKSDKVLRKRQTLITFENAASCNETRQNCIRKCRDRSECVQDCPVCPEVQTANGMRRIIIEGVNDSFVHDSPIKGTNVTTVIKLVNLVNNTNVIDIPTNVNLTNQNHVHVYQNDTSDDGGEFGLGYNRFGSCCIVVEPKSCTPTTRGYSCHHKRHKTCGQQCTTRIIHADSRQRCTSEKSCSHKISYIPQPKKPRCIYVPTWPYVSCGGHHQQSCEGCYEHYGHGAQSYYGGRIPDRCHACYDNSFNMGPLYRRGPFFRPSFYHQPPCYLTGTCHVPFCGMYGCFGNQYIDPAWGYMGGSSMYMPMPPPFSSPSQMHHQNIQPQLDYSSIAEASPNYVEIEDNLPHLPADGADWGVEVHKCRVVENNGTVIIKNCTDTEWERNPFASSPSIYPHQAVDSYENPVNYEMDGELDEHIRYTPPSAYEGFERTQWDNEIPNTQRTLHRRHAKHQRKQQIIYEE